MSLTRSAQACSLAIVLISGLLLVTLGWNSLIAGGVPAWDFAADMLLGNRIRDEGVLLVGHYSRYEFNHPGPFWFYYNYLFELGLEPSGLSRTHIWLAGQTIMATLLVGFASCGLSLFLLGRIRFLPSILATFTLCGYLGSDLVSLWMPHRLIAPYIAFLVCCLLLAQGRLLLLAFATLLTGALIHGYATMPLFTLLPLGTAVLFGWQAHKKTGIRPPLAATALIVSIVIASLFTLPFAYEALSASPSNLSKLLYAQRGFTFLPQPSWLELLEFIRSLLPPSGFWLALGAGVTALLALRPKLTISLPLLQASVFLTAVTALVALYYKHTPAPLYDFVALFATCIAPLLLAAVLIVAFNEMLKRANQSVLLKIITVLACFSLVYLTAPFKQSPERAKQQSNEFSDIANFIQRDISPGKIAAIDYSNHDLWPFMAGLLLELDRQDIAACTTWRHMGFLYTDAQICPPELQPQYRVVPADQCEKQCTFSTLNHGLRPVKLQSLALATPYDHNSQALLFQNWYPSEGLHRWSLGNASSIIFKLDKQAPTPSELSILLNSFGLQRIEIFLNEQRIYAGELNGAQIPLIIPLKQGIIQTANNTLRFALPDARQPQTADPRVLAVAFLRLQLNPKKP